MSNVRKLAMHVTEDELSLYVMGALGAARCDAVEAHVMVCEACAQGLAREAQLEAAFGEVARRAIAQPRLAGASVARRNGRFMGGVAGALAAAAAIVLMFSQTSLAADQGPSASQTRAGSSDSAVGDMSGALDGEVALVGDVRTDKLDGG